MFALPVQGMAVAGDTAVVRPVVADPVAALAVSLHLMTIRIIIPELLGEDEGMDIIAPMVHHQL